jgi:glutathione S-transferase
MLKVWGRKNSSNVQKVMWAIGELGLDHERVDVGMEFGGNRTPQYLSINPNGLVPTLQDGDLILWESNSIVRYLAGRYGAGTLEPPGLHARALANQWMDWQLSVFLPAHEPLFFGMVRTPPERRDHAAIAQAKAKTIAAAQIFDAALARQTYTAGDAFSMGDIPMGIRIYRFRQLVPERPPLPNIERWYATIEKRPAFHQHVGSIPLT